jgi:sugar (pentulose or hexulose) kinase
MRCILSLDFGGSSLKATVFGEEGVVLYRRSRSLPIHATGEGLEFSAPDWSRIGIVAACGALADAMSKGHRVDGLVVSSIRQAFVLLRDREAIGPGIMNLDSRGADLVAEYREQLDQLEMKCDNWTAPFSPILKLFWLKRHRAELFRTAAEMAFVHDWIVLSLTGELTCEPGILASAQLYSPADGLLLTANDCAALRELPRLGNLRRPGDCIGDVKDDTIRKMVPYDLPVFVGGSDTHLATLGSGAEMGDVAIVAGSTCPIHLVVHSESGAPSVSPDGSVPWMSDLHAGRRVAETSAGPTGYVRSWLASTRRQTAAKAENTTNFQRGWRGVSTGPLCWNPRDVFNMPLGIAEGIEEGSGEVFAAATLDHALNTASQLDELRRMFFGLHVGRIIVSGGAARTKEYVSVLANVTAETLFRDGENLAPLCGAAALVWPHFRRAPCLERVSPTLRIDPVIHEEHRRAHAALRSGVVRIREAFNFRFAQCAVQAPPQPR